MLETEEVIFVIKFQYFNCKIKVSLLWTVHEGWGTQGRETGELRQSGEYPAHPQAQKTQKIPQVAFLAPEKGYSLG